MKTMKTKAPMNVNTFYFGVPHYIVASKENNHSLYEAPCVLSPYATRRIVSYMIQEMEGVA